MTYRERREARADRLRDQATRKDANAAAARQAERQILDMIPPGQPILVGHHSERRHRRDLARADSLRRKSMDTGDRARERADEIDRQADHAIYSDDPDAVERLTEKIATLEARRERIKTANAEFRRTHKAELKAETNGYLRQQMTPHPSYELTNLGGVISTARKRLAQLKREAVHGPADRVITARYGGPCETCGTALTRGQTIRYNRSAGARCYPACEEATP